MSDQQPAVSKRWILTIVAAVVSAFVIGGVFALIADSAGPTRTRAGATSTTTTTSTTTPSTSSTPPLPPQVVFSCSLDGSSTNRQSLRMEVGGDFAPIWAAAPKTCEATRDPVELTPLEQQALTAAGQAAPSSITALYELCVHVDPNNPYLNPEHTLSPQQIAEVTGMLTLCPAHPQAAQLGDAVVRAQDEAAAAAAGELFYAGTFLVNAEIKPGTYAVEGELLGAHGRQRRDHRQQLHHRGPPGRGDHPGQ